MLAVRAETTTKVPVPFVVAAWLGFPWKALPGV